MTKFLRFILTASLMVGNAVAEDQNRKGAPNKIGKGQSNSSSRQSIRKPLNLGKGNGTEQPQKGGGENASKSNPNVKAGMQRKPLAEILGLTGETAEAFKAAMKSYHEAVKAVHNDKELPKDDKIGALKKAHEDKMEQIRAILNEKQLAQLLAIWHHNSRPQKNRLAIQKLLQLTPEQIKQLHALRHKTSVRKRAVLANKETTKEAKKTALEELNKQFLKIRREMLTDEQLAKLDELREKIAESRETDNEKAGKHSSGSPRSRLVLGQTGQANRNQKKKEKRESKGQE
tara:strand:+ start:461 stop:1324 length:864 start_codon:yes stop_codon:yes gene_type:complete